MRICGFYGNGTYSGGIMRTVYSLLDFFGNGTKYHAIRFLEHE
jgi:hypothetical protein